MISSVIGKILWGDGSCEWMAVVTGWQWWMDGSYAFGEESEENGWS